MRIKFNLIINGISIKNFEQLQENFYIEDILDYYKNKKKILIQWLEDRNLIHESKEIAKIDNNNSDFEIIKIISKILNIKVDENILNYLKEIEEKKGILKEIDTFSNSLDLKKKELDKSIIENFIILREKLSKILKKSNLNDTEVKLNYQYLKEKIKLNYSDLRSIRKIVDEIELKYFNEFNKDYERFFNEFKIFPLAIFAVLMNKNLRDLFFKNHKLFNYFEDVCDLYTSSKSSKKYFYLKKYINRSDKKKNKLINTNQYLILDSTDCELHVEDIHYNSSDINGKYPILKNFRIKNLSENAFFYYIKIED